ncbi:hypothetical protein, unknown function [Leishmania infantum JPCM5]|uniref:Uncharacterized protein n=2 Tax=Leishmania infantum TaxID=5671 RepID=A4HTB2_LEIIN|nr:hypothetical protein, unknown function [Leishmania infantum JPCM5]CAC9449334.1 hypothetical_protein_-_conserved [Leishmania infantum]CAM65660.1 hypothetical protein, unknown function [Leishmania infantum JPCM5]SUZ39280.1 hypothetical_protein_-_conserved [Leishmania infantum]|eukprot:XP_001463303.1 hypothetical protein, unknown function [Leishmania infantum JPCM5]
MYTISSDAVDESTTAFEWRVWGSDSSASTPVVPLGGVRDASLRSTTAATMPVASFWGDSRDDRGAAAAAASTTSPLTSSTLWSSVTVANNMRGTSNAAYKGTRAPSAATTPAGLVALSSEGKRIPSQKSSAVPADLSSHSERPNGDIGGGTSVGTFKYTAASLAVEPPHSTMPTTFRDSDDGDDEAFDIIKESIKRQLVSIEEDELVSETAQDNLAAALRQTLQPQPQPQPQPQQHRFLTVQLRGGAASEAAGARRSGDDDRIIHITSAATPPAPRSAAAARQGEIKTIRCSSSPVSVVEQLAAISIGQSSVSKVSVPLTSASGGDAKGFRSKPPSSLPQSPQAPAQKAAQLTSQQSSEQPLPQHHEPQQQRAPATVHPLNAAASRATLFEQQRQPSANGVGGTACGASPRAEASIHAGGLRIPLPTPGARSMGGRSGSGEIAAVQISTEAASRTPFHMDPSRDIGSGAATATATAMSSATSTTASSSSTSTTLQSGRFSSERSSSSKEEPASSGHHYQQYPRQLLSGSSVTQLRHGRHPHQHEIPALQLEGLQEPYPTNSQQECLQHKGTQQQQQEQPPAPPPLTPPPPPPLPQQQRVQASSMMSFQGGPRLPNLPPHLQPQPLTQAQQQSHLQHPLPQTQSQQSQQQQLGVSASSPSAAMMSGKIYAATPHGRLILLTPDGVQAPQVQLPQHSLPPPPPPPPPPPSTATSSALTGNYVTASNYSALFCRNNPLHSMRYPGSQPESAGRLAGEAVRPKDEKGTAATPFSSSERSGTQASNTTASSAASEKDVPTSLNAGQSRDDAAVNHAETRASVAPAVATAGSASAEAPPLPAARSAAATGASSATVSGSGGAAAPAGRGSQPPTASVAPLLVRNSHGASAGELAQRLGSHPSSSSSSSANGCGRPLQLPTFPTREDISITSSAGGADHPNLNAAPVSTSSSNGAAMSPLSRVQPKLVDSDRNIGLSATNTLTLPPSSVKADGSNAQIAVPANGSGTAATGSQGGAVAAELIGPSNNALGNSSTFAHLPTGLKPHDSGLGADATVASNSGYAAHFTQSASQPALSAPASSASYSPLTALGSANGSGAAKCISTQALFRQEPAGNSRLASRADLFAQAAKPAWPDTVSSPSKQGPAGAPPLPQRQPPQLQPSQQHQQLYMQGLSPPPSTLHSPLGGRLHAAADDSVVVTIPVTGGDGTITAAVIAVPSPFSYTEAGVQQYCLGALQQQHPQQQRPRPPPQRHPLPPPPQQQHFHHQGAPAKDQSTASCAGEEAEWRRKQDLITLQLEQHRQRLENELRQVQLQQAQQQQQLQHAQHHHSHHHQHQQQQQLRYQQSLLPAQTTMVTIDGCLYRMVSASSAEAYVNRGQPCRDVHFVDRDALASDGSAGADGRTEAASLQPSNHPGVCMPVSPQAQLSPQQQQQPMIITAAGDRSALGEATSAAAASLAKSSTPGTNVMLMMPTPSASHKAQYGY